MRLEQLLYIQEIAKQQSISKAAKALFISQPSLSAALSNLEQEIGVPLFIRDKQGVIPTLMGQGVLAKAEQVLSTVAEIKQINQLDYTKVTGTMKILMPYLSSCDAIHHLIRTLKEKYSELTLEFNESDVLKSIEKIGSYQAEIAIVDFFENTFPQIEQHMQIHNLTYKAIGKDNLCIFVGKDHPLAQRAYVTLDDLSPYTICTNRRDINEMLGNRGQQKLKQGYIFNDYEYTKKELIKSNESVAFMPRKIMAEDIYVQTKSIVPLPVQDLEHSEITIGIILAKREQWASAEAQIFADITSHLKDYFNTID